MIVLKCCKYICFDEKDRSELRKEFERIGAYINKNFTDSNCVKVDVFSANIITILSAPDFYSSSKFCVNYKSGEKIYVSHEDLLGSGEYFSLSDALDSDTDQIAFAKKSKLYNKIMIDGNVFNPYIHRRFLPHQFIQLFEEYGENFIAGMRENYSCKYMLKYILQESKRLSTLSTIDKKTFRERTKFFNFKTIYNVVKHISDGYIHYHIRRYNTRSFYDHCANNWYDSKSTEEKMNSFFAKIKHINSYEKLYKLLCEDEYFNLLKNGYTDCVSRLNNSWENAFMASGAYYTMKHLIMFEGYLFRESQTSLDAIKELESMISVEADAIQLFDACTRMMDKCIRIK